MDITQLFYSIILYTIDINVRQMMVGKHWVKSWGMYIYGQLKQAHIGEAREQHKAENNAIKNITFYYRNK